jgi:hypothetical protein
MAGTDKSYWRHKNPPNPTVKTAINSQGKSETYNEHTQFQYNHVPGTHVTGVSSTVVPTLCGTRVLELSGMCLSNSGMDLEYYQHEQYRTGSTTVSSANTYLTDSPELSSADFTVYLDGTPGFQVNHPYQSDKF